MARPLLECLSRHGLIIEDIGPTYQADHILKNGTIPESCLDHVYLSNEIRNSVSVKKLTNSSTDHLPVIIKVKTNHSSDKSKFKRKVTKRSFKKFTIEIWNACLANKNWSLIEVCSDVNEKVKLFSQYIEETLDEVAPIKTFSIRSQYRFGLTDKTKEIMHARDVTRGQIKNACSLSEKSLFNFPSIKLRPDKYNNIMELFYALLSGLTSKTEI